MPIEPESLRDRFRSPEACETLWRALAEDTHTWITLCDRDGTMLACNELSRRFLRAWEREAAAKPVHAGSPIATIDAEHAQERLKILRRVCDERITILYEHVLQSVRFRVSVRPFEEDGVTHALVVSRPMHAWESLEDESPADAQIVAVESHSPGEIAKLSPRELEVLKLIAEGLTALEIAERLHRSIRTVENHRESIGRKLGLRNRVEIARFAVRAGLSDLPDVAHARPERVSSTGGEPHPTFRAAVRRRRRRPGP